MDVIQIVIISIAFVLTLIVIFMSVQVWYILKEMRTSLHKINKMLDDMGKVTSTVGETATNVSGLLSGFKSGLSIFSGLRKKGEEHD
jgi:hypothetical protein